MAKPPCLTIFAGPNGSGKSTLTREILRQGYQLGTYINADDITTQMYRDAQASGQTVNREAYESPAFWEAHRRRLECVERRADFSFETVFSHYSKVELIHSAKTAGFFVRLYFVSTENSLLNVARVAKRVAEGGHPVPVEKIIDRYRRAMGNLAPACMLADEAALFDNSGSSMKAVAYVARNCDGPPRFTLIEPMPNWVIAWAYEMSSLLDRTR